MPNKAKSNTARTLRCKCGGYILTVNARQNSHKAFDYGLCGCLFVCIGMYYIFDLVLVIFFVFEIIPCMETFDINSKSVLNPNVL